MNDVKTKLSELTVVLLTLITVALVAVIECLEKEPADIVVDAKFTKD